MRSRNNIQDKIDFQTRNDFGLILSGGGLKGTWEAGVLYYIGTHSKIYYKTLLGTSIGSLIGFLSGIGNNESPQFKSLRKIFHDNCDLWRALLWAYVSNSILSPFIILSKICIANLFSSTVFKIVAKASKSHRLSGTLNPDRFIQWISNNIDYNAILNTESYYYFSSTQLDSKDGAPVRYVFSFTANDPSGRSNDPIKSIPTSLAASMCLPLVFKNVKYKKMEFLDGGIIANLPLDHLLRSEMGLEGFFIIIPKHLEKMNINDPIDQRSLKVIKELLIRLENIDLQDKRNKRSEDVLNEIKESIYLITPNSSMKKALIEDDLGIVPLIFPGQMRKLFKSGEKTGCDFITNPDKYKFQNIIRNLSNKSLIKEYLNCSNVEFLQSYGFWTPWVSLSTNFLYNM